MIGCDCEVCQSTDPRDRRLRPSILVELTGRNELAYEAGPSIATATRFVLIDTSTDLRAQALAYDVRRVDAVVFTHSHADHIFGLDEIRRFNKMQKEAIPCYADAGTIADLKRTFAYIFDHKTPKGGGIPKIGLQQIGGPFLLGGAEFIPIPLMHGTRPILGFRIGTFAYLTDCNVIPEESFALLAGVKTLIIDALRWRKHTTHFCVEDALAAAARIGATRTYFTHISHDLGHAATSSQLPPGVELAYDGLVLHVSD